MYRIQAEVVLVNSLHFGGYEKNILRPNQAPDLIFDIKKEPCPDFIAIY